MKSFIFALLVYSVILFTFPSVCFAETKQKSNDLSQLKQLVKHLIPLSSDSPDYSPVIQWIAEKPYVLLGDATHGSSEFYQSRAKISKHLISQKEFNTIVIEGNWPATYRLNQFIHGKLAVTAHQVLNGFKNASPWLWNNREVAEFITWLRDYNRKNNKKVSIYGMDIYSLFESIDEVLNYLRNYFPDKLEIAYKNTACFRKVARNAKEFLIKSQHPVTISCDQQAQNLYQLIKDINLSNTTISQQDAHFDAIMNASVIDAAAFFFRLTGQSTPFNTWNLREYFMLGQVNQIINYQKRKNNKAKIMVWAHNSHVGDSSATERIVKGEVSLGHLFRQYLGNDNVFLLGQLSYQGEVIASNQWNGEAYCMPLPKPKKQSYSDQLSHTDISNFILQLSDNPSLKNQFNSFNEQRMVGVVYNPLLDRFKNYLLSDIKRQFDALLYFKNTRALEPLFPYYGCN